MDEKGKGYKGFWKYFGITLSGIGCLVFIWMFIMILQLIFGWTFSDF